MLSRIFERHKPNRGEELREGIIMKNSTAKLADKKEPQRGTQSSNLLSPH